MGPLVTSSLWLWPRPLFPRIFPRIPCPAARNQLSGNADSPRYINRSQWEPFFGSRILAENRGGESWRRILALLEFQRG